jgi:cell fate regulator YaaT (PSP1 superfamily)
MNDDAIVVARVMMPEKGVFLVRCVCEGPPPGVQALVTLDYGADFGLVTSCAEYDPEQHGSRVPGFQLLRLKDDGDDAQIAENEKRALEMRGIFTKAAQMRASDIRVPYARLSYGRTRLFLRYVTNVQKPDLSAAAADVRRRYGVSVNAWHMGPRDEVSMLGGLGPCGRPCCCATWQTRYPAHLTAERFRGESAVSLNGTCGRFKCCLAFEKQ